MGNDSDVIVLAMHKDKQLALDIVDIYKMCDELGKVGENEIANKLREIASRLIVNASRGCGPVALESATLETIEPRREIVAAWHIYGPDGDIMAVCNDGVVLTSGNGRGWNKVIESHQVPQGPL